MELQENLQALESMNATVWGISPDVDAERMASLRDDSGLAFALLTDADSAAIRAYGILNQEHGAVPHPAVVVVDRGGVIRFFHLDEDYRRRPPVATIVEALEAVEATAAGS